MKNTKQIFVNKVVSCCNKISDGCLLRLIPLLLAIAFIGILIAFSGCKTTKVVDKTKTQTEIVNQVSSEVVKDSITTISEQSVTIIDKSQTNTDSKKKVIFGEAGGSYNEITGEYLNVVAVEENTTQKELNNIIAEQSQQVKQLQIQIAVLHDSIASLNVVEHKDIVIEEKEMNWWRWLLGGMAIGAALLIFLKKFPYTQPFFFWL